VRLHGRSRATCLSGHIVDFTKHKHINRLYTIPSIVGGIIQSVLNFIQCVKVSRGVHSRKQKLAALYMPMAGQAVQLLL
jgi:hypothetical protein